jgi:hypothetical protein
MTFTRKPHSQSLISSVDIATGHGIDDRDSIPGKDKNFISSIASREALGPTQPTIQWISGVKRLGREDDNSPPCSAEVKNGGATLPPPNLPSRHNA